MRFGLSRRAETVLLPIIGTLLVVAVYAGLAAMVQNPLVLPPVQEIGSSLVSLFADPALSSQLGATLQRVLFGYLGGGVIGLVVGVAVGAGGWLREIILPYLNFFRSVAPIAWVIPAAIWFGVGTPATVFVAMYAVAFPIAINTIAGLASTPVNRMRMAAAAGAGRMRQLLLIQIPSAAPFLLTGARQAVAYAFMSVVGAEMIAATSGLGFLIFDARTLFDTGLMFAGILVLGAIGYAADLGFLALRSTVFRRFIGDER